MRADRFEPGDLVVRRYWRQNRISFVQLTGVVADDEDGLRLWLSSGSSYWRVLAADGRTHHDATLDALGEQAYLGELTWSETDVMLWMPLARRPTRCGGSSTPVPESSAAGREPKEPTYRHAAGVDTADNALDIRASGPALGVEGQRRAGRPNRTSRLLDGAGGSGDPGRGRAVDQADRGRRLPLRRHLV